MGGLCTLKNNLSNRVKMKRQNHRSVHTSGQYIAANADSKTYRTNKPHGIFPALFSLSLLLILMSLSTAPVSAQKAFFTEVDVETFESPFEIITVNVHGTLQKVKITGKTKFRGLKNKKLAPEQVEEGTTIAKLSYEFEGEDFVATSIDTDISADGKIKVSGLFEGVIEGNIAMVDGYPIKLAPGTSIAGEKGMLKKKKCDCAGFMVPKFDHPLLPAGQFYVDIQGFQDDSGIVEAQKVTLCRNTFSKPEQQLIADANKNLTNNTSKITQVPVGVYAPPMGLYNGEIQVGQYSYPLTNNIELQGYVNQVGYRLLPEHVQQGQFEGGKVSYRFYVIDDPVPNAFAFPNGMIFIHTGLLDIVENEAQLAAILGHEIAHVTHEHGRERYQNITVIKEGEGLFQTLFNKSLKSQFYEMAPDLAPDVASTLVDFSNQLTPAAASNIMKPQTKMEAQADRVGLFYAFQAGYDIREAAKFWNKMEDLTATASYQDKLVGQLISSLGSDRLRVQTNGQNSLQKLGAAGTEVLAKQLLDTIYTSHPKAKKRARAVGKLVGTVYANTNWDNMRSNTEGYREAITGLVK